MAIVQAYKFRKKLLLAKGESSYGVDPTPTNSSNAILATNCQIKFNGTPLKRNLDRSFIGAQPSVPVGQHMELTFDTELAGSGDSDTAAKWGPLLVGASMSETVQASALTDVANKRAVGTPVGAFTAVAAAAYVGTIHRRVTLTCTVAGASGTAQFTVAAPARLGQNAVNVGAAVMTSGSAFTLIQSATITPTITTDFEVGDTWTIDLYPPRVRYLPVDPQSAGSVAFYYYLADGLHIAVGSRGTPQLVFDKQGYAKLRFRYLCLDYSLGASGGLPVGDFSAWMKPDPLKSSTFPDLYLHGYEAKARSLSIDLANQVTYKGLLNQESIEIGDRDGKGQISFITPALSAFNPKARKDAATLDRLEIMIGSAPGKIIRIEAPSVQLESVDYAEDEGDTYSDVGFSLQPVSGNDELTIYSM